MEDLLAVAHGTLHGYSKEFWGGLFSACDLLCGLCICVTPQALGSVLRAEASSYSELSVPRCSFIPS